jgi:hypothetical protein
MSKVGNYPLSLAVSTGRNGCFSIRLGSLCCEVTGERIRDGLGIARRFASCSNRRYVRLCHPYSRRSANWSNSRKTHRRARSRSGERDGGTVIVTRLPVSGSRTVSVIGLLLSRKWRRDVGGGPLLLAVEGDRACRLRHVSTGRMMRLNEHERSMSGDIYSMRYRTGWPLARSRTASFGDRRARGRGLRWQRAADSACEQSACPT